MKFEFGNYESGVEKVIAGSVIGQGYQSVITEMKQGKELTL